MPLSQNQTVGEIPNGAYVNNKGDIIYPNNNFLLSNLDEQSTLKSEEPSLPKKKKAFDGTSILDEVRSKRKNNQPVGEVLIDHIAGRRGQTKFREALLEKYKKCVVTGCDVTDVLEAAHIEPYADGGDPTVQNGLLLRSDIHTLFDLDLLGINPDGFTVELNPACNHEPYCTYSSQKLLLTDVDCNALKERYKLFQKRLL